MGLIAREIERQGVPTVVLSVLSQATRKTPGPRNVIVRFRMGQVLGEPGAAAQQRRVLWDALGAFARIREPGGTVELPYRWKRDGYTDPLAERPAR